MYIVHKEFIDSGLDITVALSVAVGVITGDPCLGAAPGIGLQSAVGAAALVIAAEAGVHQAQGVHLHIMTVHLQDELRIGGKCRNRYSTSCVI